LASPSIEAIATVFPDLEILELIGAGGMSSVYKIRHSLSGSIAKPACWGC
jgi:hypothetical protein